MTTNVRTPITVSVIVQNAAAIFSNAARQRLINWKRIQARTAIKSSPTMIFHGAKFLQGISWVLRTIESLWVWSWSQITHAFEMSWWNLASWKSMVGILFIAFLAWILFQLIKRCLAAFEKIAAAFWTMTLTVIGVLTFVVIAGAFSRGFQWVVTTVPDKFWEKFL